MYPASPVWDGTQGEYFPIGEAFFESLKEELQKAQKFIFMEYFIIQEGQMWDPILEILKKKAASGVEVRLLYDDVGTLQTLPSNYRSTLEKRASAQPSSTPSVPISIWR